MIRVRISLLLTAKYKDNYLQFQLDKPGFSEEGIALNFIKID